MYSDTPFFPQLTFLKEEMSPDVGNIHSVNEKSVISISKVRTTKHKCLKYFF